MMFVEMCAFTTFSAYDDECLALSLLNFFIMPVNCMYWRVIFVSASHFYIGMAFEYYAWELLNLIYNDKK